MGGRETMRKILSYRSWYNNVSDGGNLMDEHTERREFPCEPDEWDLKEGIGAVTLAANVIQNDLYCHEPSSSPNHHTGLWYSRTDEPDQLAPDGAEQENTSAHLEGFSPDEERAVYEELRSRKWLT